MTDSQTQVQLPSLRTPLSAYHRHIRYTLYEFPVLLDSSSISASGWSLIANTIRNNYALFDGFVVLHGTDSLAYTASALSFMLTNLGKPVILTGSQASIFALQSDATDNLLGSLIIAAHFAIPEVCLFFHHALYRGNRTTKVSAEDFAAFASPNLPPLATIKSSGADVAWHLVRRAKTLAPFSVAPPLDTAHVACLRIFPGIKPSMLDAVLRVPNLRGLVLETFGAGNAPSGKGEGDDESLLDVIQGAVERGIVIVNVTQCASGRVSATYAAGSGLSRAGVVTGRDLTSEAALTKLSWLLAVPGLEYAEIVRRMGVDVRGEMSAGGEVMFRHPTTPATWSDEFAEGDEMTGSGAITPMQSAFTRLAYAIAAGDVRTVHDILVENKDKHSLLDTADYAGNMAIHLAASAQSPSAVALPMSSATSSARGLDGPDGTGLPDRSDTAILKELLRQGASVHVRNRAAHTPLFLAASAGLEARVKVLRASGALLHVEELDKVGTGSVWELCR